MYERNSEKFNLWVTFLDYAYIIGWSKIRRNSSFYEEKKKFKLQC